MQPEEQIPDGQVPPLATEAEILEIILQPPPRPDGSVRRATEAVRRRARRVFWTALGLVLGGIAALVLLPSARGSTGWTVANAAAVLSAGGGITSLLIAWYYHSHRVVIERLVRDGTLAMGDVESVWNSGKLDHMQVLVSFSDGMTTMIVPEGHPFTRLCVKGQSLPCLIIPGKYAAVLLPNGELALGTQRLVHPRSPPENRSKEI